MNLSSKPNGVDLVTVIHRYINVKHPLSSFYLWDLCECPSVIILP